MNEKPFIHLFECSTGYYLYDVNTDAILKITGEIYKYLNNANNDAPNEQVEKLKEAGYLKSKHVQISEHPATKLLPSYYATGLHSLTLQVTQECNLRCDYCVYSGKYNTRTHSHKKMSYEMCKRGIDYLFAHSSDRQELSIGFYGGEPLLEYSLIKKCVDYIEKQKGGKKVIYRMTTNATLLDEEKTHFLVEHKFKLTISFDGPQEIHDKCRKYANSDKGTYDVVIKNVRFIRDTYYEYFKEHVFFSTVLNPQMGFSCVGNYIKGEKLFQDTTVIASLISETGIKEKIKTSKEFIEEYNYEYFKLLLSKLGEVGENNVSQLIGRQFEYIRQVRGGKHLHMSDELPEKWHHGGPCIPGERSIFLSINGNFYPCERVSENTDMTVIGDLENGIDIAKAEKILNIEKYTQMECRQCWAYKYCDFCIRYADSDCTKFRQNIINKCTERRQAVEMIFKDYCVMRELGYDFETKQLKK